MLKSSILIVVAFKVTKTKINMSVEIVQEQNIAGSDDVLFWLCLCINKTYINNYLVQFQKLQGHHCCNQNTPPQPQRHRISPSKSASSLQLSFR